MPPSAALTIASQASCEPLHALNLSRGDDKADPSQLLLETYPDPDRLVLWLNQKKKSLYHLHEMARLKNGLHRPTVRSDQQNISMED